jgi:hypothetical protein
VIALIVGAALALGGPPPPEVTDWFHAEAPALLSGLETSPLLTHDSSATGPLTLTEPFPELQMEPPAFDLSTGTAAGPTTPDAILRPGDVYCALVVQDGRALGGMICADQLDDGSLVRRPMLSTLVTDDLVVDSVFWYDGLFAMVGDEVRALDSEARLPGARADGAVFFAALTRQWAEVDAVRWVEQWEVNHAQYPPLLAPRDPEWDALVQEGLARQAEAAGPVVPRTFTSPPVPADVRAWFRDEAPGVVQRQKSGPSGALTLSAPVRELWVRHQGFDLTTGTAHGPTALGGVLEKGQAYCALVLVHGKPSGDLQCAEWPDQSPMWSRELEETELTELPPDGFFRVAGGNFAVSGDQVVPLDSEARVHVPGGTADGETFFRMLAQREAEQDVVARVTGDPYSPYPPLLGPPDAAWDVLVAKGLTLPEPIDGMEEGTALHEWGREMVTWVLLVGVGVLAAAGAAAWLIRRGRLFSQP